MRRIIVIGLAAALSAGLMLVPAGASARHKSKHASCPRSARVDRNHDRIPDRWECRHNLSLKVKQTKRDQDRDGLNNLGEFQAGDDPHKADSDNDGINDGAEHAGKIKSFVADPGSPNTGTLTISLDGGGEATGKVTATTECKVETTTPTARASSDGSGDHQGSGDSGNSGSEDHPGVQGSNTGDNETENRNEPNDNENEGDHACTASDLGVGRDVKEAEIELTNGSAVFDEIKLG